MPKRRLKKPRKPKSNNVIEKKNEAPFGKPHFFYFFLPESSSA